MRVHAETEEARARPTSILNQDGEKAVIFKT